MGKSGYPGEGKVLKFTPQEFERRQNKIRAGMQFRNMECLVVVDRDIIQYISGAAGHTTAHKAATGSGVLIFPLVETPVLFVVSSFHAAMMQKESSIPVRGVSFRKGQPEGVRIRDYSAEIIDTIKELGIEKRTIGLASWRSVPAYLFEEIKRELPYADFISASDLMMECRRTKSAEELEFVRRAAECADAGIQALVETARPGVTEAELVAACDYAMVKAGSDRGSMLLLGAGPFEEMQGAITEVTKSRRKLKEGDIILNELSPIFEGYTAQVCVPISIGGQIPQSFKDRMNVDKALYELALNELRQGNRYGEIDKKVFEAAEKLVPGFYKRAWALQPHEIDPALDRITLEELRPGTVWVNHPWTVPASGKGYEGHTIGNTVIVTEDEPEVTSRWPCEIVVI
ncbi:MAG: aminopeptidase P family protein [Deltaproteobacteria bacterium]|nr:aminopeptidase P family protein [Deltaproteobacteria bacterium]